MKAYTEDKRKAVEIMGEEGNYMAVAVQCDGQSYGGDSYWFSVGHFKTIKGAQHSAIRQMARLGYKLSF